MENDPHSCVRSSRLLIYFPGHTSSLESTWKPARERQLNICFLMSPPTQSTIKRYYYCGNHTPTLQPSRGTQKILTSGHSGQTRVYRVTQLRTDGVLCRESAGIGSVNLKVVPNECCLGRSPWPINMRLSFPHPLLV